MTQFHIRKVGVHPDGTQAGFFVFGPTEIVQAWAAASNNVWTAQELMQDNSTIANQIKRRLAWWRIDGTLSTTEGPITIVNQAYQLGPLPLPATIPSVGSPWTLGNLSVTRLYRPALGGTICGESYSAEGVGVVLALKAINAQGHPSFQDYEIRPESNGWYTVEKGGP